MKRILSAFAIIASLFLIGCGGDSGTTTSTNTEKETAPSFDLAAARKTIDSLNTEFSGYVSKGDTVGLASLYSSDATIMVPNMATASSRSGVQTVFNHMLGEIGPVNIALATTDLWGYESLLTEVGTYTMTKDGKQIDKGKYIDLWKMEDGKWKLHRDIFNSDLPCPPAH
jgi:ketosteroid isomerase-like protein